MDSVFLAGVSGTPPTPAAVPLIGHPQSGNPGGGVSATKPGPWWFYMITQEMRNIILAAGIDPDHAQVDQVLQALLILFPSFDGAGHVALPADASAANHAVRLSQVMSLLAGASTIGMPGHWPGSTPPAGWIKRNGALLPRSGGGSYPLLTALVLSGDVNVVSEATWPSNPGAFTLGDGATTIRIPDGRGLIDKGYHDGSGTFTTDTTRALGSYEADQVLAHSHSVGLGTRDGGNTGRTAGSTSGNTA